MDCDLVKTKIYYKSTVLCNYEMKMDNDRYFDKINYTKFKLIIHILALL